jgi:ABC-type bacteriocin/lantibiotic exporter with double-glycine peptidase domain
LKKICDGILAILTRREKKKLGFLLLLNLAISIIDIASLALLLFIVHFYTQSVPGHSSFLPQILSNQNSVLLIALFLLFFSVKSIAGYFILEAQYKFVYSVASGISERNLLNYLEGSFADYVNIDSAVQVRKISQQPIEFAHYVLAGVQLIITESMLVLLTVMAILFFNAKLFLLLFLILMPAVIAISFLIKKKLRAVRANVKIKGEKTLQYLHETLSGFVESNIYDRNDFFARRYGVYQHSLNKYLAELQITQGVSSRIIEAFAVLGLFILIGVNKLSGNAVELTAIAAFVAAAYKIIPGIVKILNTTGQVKAYEFAVHGLAREVTLRNKQKETYYNKINSVSFNNIEFSYGKNLVLADFNLTLNAGDFVGISGHSGKGKTTIANLLLGFMEPDKGSVSINNKECNAMERQCYWNDIAYVKQQPFLIHDSVLNNIALGDEQYDNGKLKEVLKASGLSALLDKFPEGLQKMITESGKNISGGQRQRIAIARALYKNATAIILDEPFNELDEDSEQGMMDYFRCLAKRGKIIVLITHHKKSFSFCNKIISLDESER